MRPGPQSDSSNGVPIKSKPVRQAPRRTASNKHKRVKRPRPEEESEDEDDKSDEAKLSVFPHPLDTLSHTRLPATKHATTVASKR